MIKNEILKCMDMSMENSLSKLNDAIDDLLGAKYILAAGKISHILCAIASSQPLYNFFSKLTIGYNFLEQFEKLKRRDEMGKPYMEAPKKTKEQLCFTFCLLYAIDTNKLELKTLLHTFYTHPTSANFELNLFCDDIIVPFKKNINIILSSKFVEQKIPQDDDVERAQKASEEPDKTAINYVEKADIAVKKSDAAVAERNLSAKADKNDTLEQLKGLALEIVGLIERDITLNKLEQEELLLVADGFNEALKFGDKGSLRLMYVALKNTLKTSSMYKRAIKQYDKLESLYAKI